MKIQKENIQIKKNSKDKDTDRRIQKIKIQIQKNSKGRDKKIK